MLPQLWLLVGSKGPRDRPTDRQCQLLSCPGQLKSHKGWKIIIFFHLKLSHLKLFHLEVNYFSCFSRLNQCRWNSDDRIWTMSHFWSIGLGQITWISSPHSWHLLTWWHWNAFLCVAVLHKNHLWSIGADPNPEITRISSPLFVITFRCFGSLYLKFNLRLP